MKATPEILAPAVDSAQTPLNHLVASIPLGSFGILLTLSAYCIGLWLYRRLGCNPWLQPVVTSVFLIILVLLLLDIPYETYFNSASFIHQLLGTATVALAIPLYHNLPRIREHWRALTVTLFVSGILAAGSAVAFAWILGADPTVLLSLAPKSITTPIAIGVSEMIGGYPSLTATSVIFTGLLVAAIATPLLRWMKIQNPVAQGAAIGMIGHGIGTARALEIDLQAGAFAALSMGLMGLYTALVLPWVVHFWWH